MPAFTRQSQVQLTIEKRKNKTNRDYIINIHDIVILNLYIDTSEQDSPRCNYAGIVDGNRDTAESNVRKGGTLRSQRHCPQAFDQLDLFSRCRRLLENGLRESTVGWGAIPNAVSMAN